MSATTNAPLYIYLAPTKCDHCEAAFRPAENGVSLVFDARAKTGLWGYFCCECFAKLGCSLGRGKGQAFIFSDEDHAFRKVL